MSVEANDGSLEHTITTLNQTEAITMPNESPPPLPIKVGIWDQVRMHIDTVSKLASALSSMLLAAWSVGLLIGGIFFLLYYWSIGFIPELDLKASVTLLAASAMTGTITLLIIVIVLLGPAVMWRLTIQTSTLLKGFWYKEGKLVRMRAFWWLVLPAWGVLAGPFIAGLLVLYEVEGGGIVPQYYGYVSSLMTAAIVVVCLRIIHKLEWKAILVFFMQFSGTVFLFLSAFLVVFKAMQWAAFSDTTATKAFIDYTLVLFMIILLDGMIATEWSNNTNRLSSRTIAFIILVAMFLFLISMLMSIQKAIPNQIMHQYKLGFLPNVSLILNEVGCTIAQGHGLQAVPVGKDSCRLSKVMIHSRLGSMYYVEADGDGSSARFIIPTQHVLSWAVTDSKMPSTTKSPDNGNLVEEK